MSGPTQKLREDLTYVSDKLLQVLSSLWWLLLLLLRLLSPPPPTHPPAHPPTPQVGQSALKGASEAAQDQVAAKRGEVEQQKKRMQEPKGLREQVCACADRPCANTLGRSCAWVFS